MTRMRVRRLPECPSAFKQESVAGIVQNGYSDRAGIRSASIAAGIVIACSSRGTPDLRLSAPRVLPPHPPKRPRYAGRTRAAGADDRHPAHADLERGMVVGCVDVAWSAHDARGRHADRPLSRAADWPEVRRARPVLESEVRVGRVSVTEVARRSVWATVLWMLREVDRIHSVGGNRRGPLWMCVGLRSLSLARRIPFANFVVLARQNAYQRFGILRLHTCGEIARCKCRRP